MKIPQNKFQIPFTKENLMDRWKFTEFCRKQGINISMSELKELYENKIIFPAIRVLAGCIAIRKIKDNDSKYYYADDIEKNSDLEKLVEKEVYYKAALVVRSGKDWLDWYEKRNMYSFPSEEQEMVMVKQTNGFFSNKEDASDDSEVFYDKHQFIALKLVVPRLRMTNRLSSEKKKMWQENVRKEVTNFYECLRFYPHIQSLKQDLEQDSHDESNTGMPKLAPLHGEEMPASQEGYAHFVHQPLKTRKHRPS